MSVRRTLTVCAIGVGLGIVVLVVGGIAWLNHSLDEGIRYQAALNSAAKPLFDTVVTKRLKIGDPLGHATDVLQSAGLPIAVMRETPKPRLHSIYRTGEGCGFSIFLELDSEDRISHIDIQEFCTGL